MKNYRSALPPLDYLLFFEAVARHQNFTKAAQELNVSQAAVSKRIKVLEEWLNIPLIHRNGRAIELSTNGRKLASNTSEALDYLSLSMSQLRHQTREKLSLASNVAISQFWLTPRINEYLLSTDAVPITVTASDKESDILNAENDVVVYYGDTIPVGWDGVELFEETWQPLLAPSLLAQGRPIESLKLLDFDKLALRWINWSDFSMLTGYPEFSETARVNLGSYGSSLDAAIRGKGIALGSADVLSYEIEAERLVALEGYMLPTGRSYYVIWKSGTLSQRTRDLLKDVGITNFHDWSR
ncbi:LysR family transcriptional regulator [Cochlodiniinecator piscidefendens]|uniref:LysR family transcriptional regulator n=1 Tax=Cochlodiniinecator piscidefendens TaxID=2715756 RepID=UPI00140E215E|nr:LysR family transcriptional regulator [Cochlodiniinecator piscidefendens]